MALIDGYSVLLSSISFFPDGLMLLYFWRTVSLLREESAFWGFSNYIILQSEKEQMAWGFYMCVSASVLMGEHPGSPGESGSLLLPLSCC